MVVFIDNLNDLRERIKGIDYSIMALIAQRITLAKHVGMLKQQAGLPVKNFQVEKQVYDRIRNFASEFQLNPDVATSIYELLIEESVEIQLSNMVTEKSGGRCLIVGGLGEMGGWLRRFLETTGYAVEIKDKDANDILPQKIDHDYVFITTPLHTLPEVLDDVCSRVSGAVVFEIGSLKSQIEEKVIEINRQGVELISIHPMFGPSVRHLSGKNILVCTHSGMDEQIMGRVKEIFGSTLASLVPVPLEEHDNIMLYSLDLSHFLNLLNGRVLLNSIYSMSELLSSAGTTFLKQFSTTRELYHENPDLYYYIQHLNKSKSRLFEEVNNALNTLIIDIQSQSKEKFVKEMHKVRDFLG